MIMSDGIKYLTTAELSALTIDELNTLHINESQRACMLWDQAALLAPWTSKCRELVRQAAEATSYMREVGDVLREKTADAVTRMDQAVEDFNRSTAEGIKMWQEWKRANGITI